MLPPLTYTWGIAVLQCTVKTHLKNILAIVYKIAPHIFKKWKQNYVLKFTLGGLHMFRSGNLHCPLPSPQNALVFNISGSWNFCIGVFNSIFAWYFFWRKSPVIYSLQSKPIKVSKVEKWEILVHSSKCFWLEHVVL